MPEVGPQAMQILLDAFAAALPEEEHVALLKATMDMLDEVVSLGVL